MTRALLVLACGLMVLAGPDRAIGNQQPGTYSTVDSPQGKMVVIDGKVHPEELPEHWLWRSMFHHIALLKKMDRLQSIDAIGLSAEDLARVLKTAAAQETRDKDCEKRITAASEELQAQHAKPDALRQSFRDITIECRTRDLDARDQLLDALAEDGRFRLLQWITDSRRKLTAYVPVGDLDYFKRPQ